MVRLLLPWVNVCLLLAALVGVVSGSRLGASRLLPVYLGFGVLCRVPLLLWRQQFHTWSYWLLTELVCAFLALALAVELFRLVFRRLPIGRRRAAYAAVLVLAVTWIAVVLIPAPPAAASANWIYYEGSLRAAQAKCASGVLFAVLLGFAFYYGLPLDPLHREVAAGLALWELLQACTEPMAVLDPFLGIGRQGFQRLIYTGVLVAWAQAAWRREEVSALSPVAMRLLQPWRTPA